MNNVTAQKQPAHKLKYIFPNVLAGPDDEVSVTIILLYRFISKEKQKYNTVLMRRLDFYKTNKIQKGIKVQ